MTQQQLESYLWGAANILRGLVDAGDYKQFIFPLVFYKRLSDVWDEDYARALAEYDGAEELAKAEANERFVVPNEAHWKQVRTVAKDLGRAIQDAMRAIEAANPKRLDGRSIWREVRAHGPQGGQGPAGVRPRRRARHGLHRPVRRLLQ